MNVTNTTDINLPLAVWLMHDEYDYIDKPNYISATSLMKPLRHLVLPQRVPKELKEAPDVQDYIPSALGSSLHAAIERAWTDGHAQSLKALGYPEKVIDRVLVNPTDEELAQVEDPIPIYLEQRAFRDIDVNGTTFTVGGKFDMVTAGIVQDVKSTTAYTWVYGGKDEDYKLQGSIYRWLNPDKITEDYIRINFIFTDWQRAAAKGNPNYPQSRVAYKDIPLMTLEETEAWIHAKLAQLLKHRNSDEKFLPECSDHELWMSDPQFKYFADPTKTTGRSTKNFETLLEANKFMSEKGKGVVITVPGEPKRCGYCAGFPICSQKNKYFS